MDALINDVAEILSDYENDIGQQISTNSIRQWIVQFDNNDREFLLEELISILHQTYLSKEIVVSKLNDILKKLTTQFKFDNVIEFLKHTKFLKCQDDHKSQSVILNLLNDIIKKEYEIEIKDCGKSGVKYLFYIDDTLASGGTFRKNILELSDEYKKSIADSNITLISIFFILHIWGYRNTTYALSQTLKITNFANKIKTYHFHLIDNDPRINFYNTSPKLNHVYPIDSNDQLVHDYLKSLDNLDILANYNMKNSEFAFRDQNLPKTEEFYSTPDNRNRYEKIILDKSIEIVNNIEQIKAKGLRPLGFTHPSYKILGTGSHAFTWRNISNTCPLVFWWENHGWFPLFPVANRG